MIWPKFCLYIYLSQRRAELASRGQRLDGVMNTDGKFFAIIVGGIVVAAIAIFIFTGGELGGKKSVEGDDDLPPIATTDK
jgi:hypothetical protein